MIFSYTSILDTHLQSCNTCNTSKGKICEHSSYEVNVYVSLCLSLTVTIAKSDSVLPYVALTVIFVVLALLLFVALLAVAACLCVRHRKRIIGKAIMHTEHAYISLF